MLELVVCAREAAGTEPLASQARAGVVWCFMDNEMRYAKRIIKCCKNIALNKGSVGGLGSSCGRRDVRLKARLTSSASGLEMMGLCIYYYPPGKPLEIATHLFVGSPPSLPPRQMYQVRRKKGEDTASRSQDHSAVQLVLG